MHTGQFQWTTNMLIGFVVGSVVAIVAALILIALLVAMAYATTRSEKDEFRTAFIVCLVFTLLLAGGIYGVSFPHEKKYHAYETITGTVDQVASRQVAKGEGFEQKFVVRFAESGQEYGCEDTRCALIRPGDEVELKCLLKWDRTATDGYDCKFGENHGTAHATPGQ